MVNYALLLPSLNSAVVKTTSMVSWAPLRSSFVKFNTVRCNVVVRTSWTKGVIGTFFQTYATNKACYQAHGQSAPPPSVPAGTFRPYVDARALRVSQAQYLKERLPNGVSPAAVAGMNVLLAQFEAQQTLRSLAVSITSDVSGYNCE